MSSVVRQLRQFNRSYTSRIGLLSDRFLGRDRPLGPSRMLWEIGPGGIGVAELRDRLGLDSGYGSRLLRSLETDGLVVTEPDPADGRRRTTHLTAKGQREWAEIDRLSDEHAHGLVAPLGPAQQRELEMLLERAERLIRASAVTFDVVDPSSDEAIASMTSYFEELADRFPDGFDPGDTLVSDAPGMRQPDGAFVIAHAGGDVVACGGVHVLSDGIAEIKRMWVEPAWRGVGVGKRLLATLEADALELGNGTIRLDTNSVLTTAIGMYRSAGYDEIDRYNDNPFARHWFEKR